MHHPVDMVYKVCK